MTTAPYRDLQTVVQALVASAQAKSTAWCQCGKTFLGPPVPCKIIRRGNSIAKFKRS
ncbi:hypothetical protein FD38_GL002306 [Levilactobacillus zymae DSM 19395]|nr:hypothetical protein FD38_GL002306 [Levilactobacillus zymae DSM 19395]